MRYRHTELLVKSIANSIVLLCEWLAIYLLLIVQGLIHHHLMIHHFHLLFELQIVLVLSQVQCLVFLEARIINHNGSLAPSDIITQIKVSKELGNVPYYNRMGRESLLAHRSIYLSQEMF